MELRVLNYFLSVAREQNFSAAAKSLHLSQPTLSRQIKDLEDELGKQLLIRGNRKVLLTEEGMLLRKRAEEILNLVEKTEKEILVSDETVSGDIYIGSGESEGVRLLVRAAKQLCCKYPNVHIHIVSGDSLDLLDRLDKGLFDFAVVWDPTDVSDYESLLIPYTDTVSLLMPSDCELAQRESVALSDLADYPLIVSRHQMENDMLKNYHKYTGRNLNIVATYNLMFNASIMVEEGLGYAIGFDHIIDTTGTRNLVSRPIKFAQSPRMHLIWKKYQMFTKASNLFLQELQAMLRII